MDVLHSLLHKVFGDLFKNLGFTEAKLLIEFGYPSQKFTLQKNDLEAGDCE